MTIMSRLCLATSLAVGAALTLGGCVDDGLATDPDVAEASQAITCTGSACDGLPVASTSCASDAGRVASGAIWNGATRAGTVELYYSPACQSVYSMSYFSASTSHRVCAVRRATPSNLPVCSDVSGVIGVSPLRHLGVGKTAFGRAVVLQGGVETAITGRTADYTRTF